MGPVVSPPAALRLACQLGSLVGLSLALSGCSGSSSTQTIPPASYSIAATSLSPSSINAGNSSASTVTITPAYGYTGKVTLSCSSITGGGSPAPACSFSANPVTIAGASAGATLTVATSATTPAATYSIQLKATDASGMAPSNALPSLQLVTIPPAAYSLTATGLSPSSINTGNSATSTISVTPANDYTGNVTLSCSSITGGGTPSPACAFSPNPVAITGTSSGTANLTVSTNFGTPAANYTVQVSATDAGGLAPSNGVQSLQLATTQSIHHVVVIFQENRTPDNLFQDPVLIARQADIVGSGVNSTGATIQLTQIDLGTTTSNPDQYDPDHSHLAFTKMCDFDSATGACKMDGADLITVYCQAGATNCPPTNPQFKYVNPSEVQPYFAMAEQYTFGDRMFQTNQGPSFPAHQFLISGTSAPSPGSDLFAENNPKQNSGDNTGCIAPPTETVSMIDPNGVETTQYPCFDHETLTDLLNAAGISWRYYANSAGSIWTAPNAIQHMCGPNAAPPNGTSCTGSDWTNNVDLKYTDILTHIANNQLPQVAWVTPNGLQSDHATSTDGSGPSWVAAVVNAIGASPYWSNTVIFITWDDWGGWYDHVSPKIINSYEYGFRVPLIVISPYARAQYISHNTHDFGSMLKFIEENFGLSSLGYADAAADDFADCFNFSQTPLTFQTISAPLKAAFFLNDKRPPTDPDDD